MNKWFCNANRPETNVSDDLNSKSLSRNRIEKWKTH